MHSHVLFTPHSLRTGLILITPFLSNSASFTSGTVTILLVKKDKIGDLWQQKKCIKESLRAIFHHSTQVMNCTAILISWMSPSRALLQRALNVHLIGFMLIHFKIKLCQMDVSAHPPLSCQLPGSLVSRLIKKRRKIFLDSGRILQWG